MQSQKLIVWLVLDSGKIGGIETHVFQLSQYLVRQGHEVKVIFLNDYLQQPTSLRLKNAGISTDHLNGSFKSFFDSVRHEKPHVLHAHGYKPGVFCKLLKFFLRVPVVCTHHPGSRGVGRIYFYNWMDETSAFIADYSIPVNEMIKKRLFTRKLSVIPNFIELPREIQNISNFKYSIGFVGRVCHEKGPDLFCELSLYFKQPLKMHLFGSGELLQSLKDKYQKKIIFHGDVENVFSSLTQMDLLCITSRSEGLPLVALEAMALGIPVVSFAVGGLSSLIHSGKNGFLVEPNQVKKIAETVNHYYQLNSQEILSIKHAAQQTIAQHYSSEIIGPKIEAVYRSVCRI